MPISPWLSVREGARAIEFYKSAFGATEAYHFDGHDRTVVSRLAAYGGEFRVADESPDHKNFSPESLSGSTVRMILTLPDPDTAFAQALKSGATEVYPVTEGHGWRIGRIVDPFGHHWEIGRPLTETW